MFRNVKTSDPRIYHAAELKKKLAARSTTFSIKHFICLYIVVIVELTINVFKL